MDNSIIVQRCEVLDIPDTMPPPGKVSHFDALTAVKPANLSFNAWAAKAGLNRAIFANMREHDNPTTDTLTKLLDAADVSQAAFDAVLRGAPATVLTEVRAAGAAKDGDRRSNSSAPQNMPHYGAAIGGEIEGIKEHVELIELYTGEVLEWVDRPDDLRDDPMSYRLTIVGDSMVPRFNPGERVDISPRAPVRVGDDVIIQLRNDDDDERVKMVLIKAFVRRTATGILLRQYNPALEFEVSAEQIVTDSRGRAAIHRVRGAIF